MPDVGSPLPCPSLEVCPDVVRWQDQQEEGGKAKRLVSTSALHSELKAGKATHLELLLHPFRTMASACYVRKCIRIRHKRWFPWRLQGPDTQTPGRCLLPCRHTTQPLPSHYRSDF